MSAHDPALIEKAARALVDSPSANTWEAMEDAQRALFRADAEAVLDAVADQIRAQERERIARAIEAERFDFTFGPQKGNSEAFQKGFRRALGAAARIAREAAE